MEAGLDLLKSKLNRDDCDITIIDKSLVKLEKKLLKIESEFDNSESTETDKSDSDSDSDSVKEYDLQSIIKSIENLEKILEKNLNDNIPIEDIIKIYSEFKVKLKSIKNQNDNFKLSVQYLDQ